MNIKKMMSLIAFLSAAYFAYIQLPESIDSVTTDQTILDSSEVEQVLEAAFYNRTSDLQVELTAVVSRVLPDDLKGSRHQRFIIELHSGLSLLIAHNIDVAPRVTDFRSGDRVTVYGEYEWNERGGVIHWTHRDKRGKHIDGWIKHNDKIYD